MMMRRVLVRTHLRKGRPVRAHYAIKDWDKYFHMGERDRRAGRPPKGKYEHNQPYKEGYVSEE